MRAGGDGVAHHEHRAQRGVGVARRARDGRSVAQHGARRVDREAKRVLVPVGEERLGEQGLLRRLMSQPPGELVRPARDRRRVRLQGVRYLARRGRGGGSHEG